ncbi:carbon-nitrogen hydrolase family protein [Pseudomonas sp. NPDC089752]|uniref:carbon-nitrogen hydrolase family protein n=1 Tax=Pseudomonas sp. NPDC089752 TaxID=3364472 RepID=UPI00382612E1
MGTVHPKYKVAAVQAAPAWNDLEGSIQKCIHYIEEAARAGCELVAFPETFIPGYPWHIWVESPAGTMVRGYVQRYFDNSLDYKSPEAERIRQAVKKAGITAVLGLSERSGGSLYIAQWIIGPDGETISTRRKVRPTHAERTVYGEGDGSDLKVHDTPLGRLGALSCWENLLSLNKFAMYAQHEQVHVAAWPSYSIYQPFAYALGPECANAISQVYAIEGGCFVIAPCAVISPEMIEELCDTPEKRELLKAGGGHTVIYGPDGRLLAEKLPEDGEGLVIAELDLGLIGIAKNAMDPVGHYSRPDVYRLLHNKTPSSRVEHLRMPLDQQQFDKIESIASAEVEKNEQ